MTADPEIVPDARNIPLISYIEVMELSYFGAKVLHPRAIEPAIRNDLPVRVLNTFDPDFTGTLVVKEQEQGKEVVKAVTVIENIALINISGAGMVGTIGVAARVFGALADAGVNITMISQGSSEANISIVVEESHLNIAADAIRSEFRNGVIRELTMNPDVSAVAVVGAGMVGIPGIAARVFTAMGSAGINVIMISQGSSEHNISFVVQSDDAERAVRALHNEFGLGLPRS
jgi:aspartate kinase